MPARRVPADRRRVLPRLRPGADRRDLLRRRLDAAFGRRADHPHRGDPAAAARQHRPARRRHPRAARPRLDSGLDRHPDALRHPARLPADAGVRRTDSRTLGRLPRDASLERRAGGRTSTSTSSSLLKAWYGDARDARRTSSASAGCRASAAITRTSATGSTWPTARTSKGCSSWDRTPRSARRTRGSSAGRSPS